MAILRISALAANAELDALTALFDVGGPGYIEYYDNSGGLPANVAAAATGVLIATSIMSATAFPVAVNGVATGNAIAQSSNVIAGGPYTVGWARVYDGAGTAIMDCDAGVGAAFTVDLAAATVNTTDGIITQSFVLTQGGI